MAKIGSMKELKLENPKLHGEVEATFTMFEVAGDHYLQIDTYGSLERKLVGKKSQSIQFGPEGISALKELLNKL